MMMKFLKYFIILFIFLPLSCYTQLYRAKSANSYFIKYDLNYTTTTLTKVQEESASLNQNRFLMASSSLTWFLSIFGVLFVGLSGILPVAILPQLANNHNELINSVLFKCLLSFAAGSLIGDVFIHLLPETYTKSVLSDMSNSLPIGLWTIFGLLAFMVIEKMCPDDDDDDDSAEASTSNDNNGKIKKQNSKTFFNSIKIMGLLNLVANIVDNFTHGIAVAGSFQASHKFGLMTLLATLLHEVPHEIGDFVILLKSGLTYQQAACAQLMTASAGIIGAIFALAYTSAKDAGDVTSWILPFTSGGFLYIALVGIVPELVKEKNLSVSIKQIISLKFGIMLIYALAKIFH